MTKNATAQDTVILDVQHKPGGIWRIRVFWFAGLFTALVFSLAIIAGWRIVVTVAPYALGLAGLVTLAVVLFGFYELGQTGVTRHKEHTTQRRMLEAQARQAEASARQAEFYRYGRSEGVIRHTPTGLDVLALPAPTGGSQAAATSAASAGFDFFELMTESKRAYALFGGQQVGKSTAAHHIARFWQDRGVMPVVIGQKFDAHEYTAGIMRFGPDEADILEGFDLVRQEAEARQRLADTGTGFNEMQPLPVFLEDATTLNTIVDPGTFETFTRQVLTVYAARLVVVYFVVHGMDLSAFGLRAGAALKNHLVCLYFETPADKARYTLADVSLTGSLGYTQREEERYPVTGCPARFAQLTSECEPALYSLRMDLDPQPKSPADIPPDPPTTRLTKDERAVLRAYGHGKTISAIAEAIFGRSNGYNNGKVKDVLAKYDVPIRDGRKREDVQV